MLQNRALLCALVNRIKVPIKDILVWGWRTTCWKVQGALMRFYREVWTRLHVRLLRFSILPSASKPAANTIAVTHIYVWMKRCLVPWAPLCKPFHIVCWLTFVKCKPRSALTLYHWCSLCFSLKATDKTKTVTVPRCFLWKKTSKKRTKEHSLIVQR